MGLLTGFTTILVVIVAGAVLAHRGVLDARSQRTLGEIAFFVASPALMVVTISQVEIGGAAPNLVASAAALTVSFALHAVIGRFWWKPDRGDLVIGGLAASYANAGNLGMALAAYVVGDITVVVPTLLVQMLVVQPLALMVLDARGGSVRTQLGGLVSNPLTLAALVGVVLATTGWTLPALVGEPLRVLAGAAIPLMLLSYGAALRLSPPLGRSGHNREVATAVLLKLAVMPVIAWAVATAMGVGGTALLGITLTAALPTAQNIFLHSTRYRAGEAVAREAILVSMIGSLPVALLVAVLLG